MLVVLLHWSIMNVVEFQFTKAIQQDVYEAQEETYVMGESEIVLGSEAEAIVEKNYEQEIARKLGLIHVIANAFALIIQLVLASRIITRFGVIATMLIHPLITVLNILGLTLRFNFTSAAITRGSYELTGILFKNAYDSSYYAVPHHKRSHVKEVMQGIMKPLGAIFGTMLIIMVALNLKGSDQTLTLNLILMTMALFMSVLVIQLSKRYTEMSEKNLSRKMDLPTRLNAIEILAQNGHATLPSSLYKLLKRENEPEVIKQYILKTLAKRQEPESIGSILELLNAKENYLRLGAAEALQQFLSEQKKNSQLPFTKYRIIQTLKGTLQIEENRHIQEILMKTFYEIDSDGLTQYIFDSIESQAEKRGDFIRMLKLFSDTNLKHFLESYLEDKNPEVRAATLIALWQFKGMQSQLLHYLKQLLDSPKQSALLAGIKACGEIKYKALKKDIRKHLISTDQEIKDAALITLGELEDEKVIPILVSHFTNPDHEWFNNTQIILNRFSKRYKRSVKSALHIHTSELISIILEPAKDLKHMEKDVLEHLKALYSKINGHHEVHSIQMTLDSSD